MLNLQHNVVSILYSVKSMIESHLGKVEEKCLEDPQKRLWHAEQILNRCHRQTARALEITKRLGRIMKMRSENEVKRNKVSIRFAWKRVLAHLRKNHHSPVIEVIERIPRDFPPILCDRTEIREILYLLTNNALQAMDAHVCYEKKLVIRVQHAYSVKEDPFAIITIADTGPGIPESTLTHVFEPFYTTKPDGEGNGFGLYLVKELVRKNKGRVTVSSVEGQGTSFSIEFPVHVSAAMSSNRKLAA